MRIDRESFIRFAVAVALACYDLPTDRAMTSEEAAQLVKWVIDMALGPDASNVQVEPITRRSARSIIMWHSSTRISPASFQHISLIRDIVFFCTSKVVL